MTGCSPTSASRAAICRTRFASRCFGIRRTCWLGRLASSACGRSAPRGARATKTLPATRQNQQEKSLMFRSSRSILLAASLLACGVHAACGDELRLLSAAAMQTVFKETAGEFEHQSGHRLNIEYATMGAIDQRVMAGETADVVIGSLPSISGLVTAGRLHSQATICKVGVGIVSPTSSP